MDLIKKYNAQIEIIISGTAGPVIKAIGSNKTRKEKNLISTCILWSLNKLENGLIRKLYITPNEYLSDLY